MAVLSINNPTLLDLAKQMDPGGKAAVIAEILNQTNEILDDMVWIEGNLPTGHRTTIRSGLPTPTWRKLYGGVQPNKATTIQVTDSCGMLEAYAEVDKALADLNGNTQTFRLNEDRAHIEGISQQLALALMYSNEAVNPEQITGLAPRYNTMVSANANNYTNVLAGGGAGSDNTSVWLVVWGNNTVHGIIPKGSKAGIQMEDKGQATVENIDGNGGRAEVYRSHYRMDAGLSVRDWRYVVRICNISKGALTKNASSGADLIDLMTQAVELIPNLNAGKPAFYVSRNTRSFLRRQIANKVTQSTLSMDMVAGKHVMTFADIPVRRVDALAADEALVT